MTSPENATRPSTTDTDRAVAKAVKAERGRIAREMRNEAQSLAPNGLGTPNDCDMADLLLAWAEGLSPSRKGSSDQEPTTARGN